MPVSVRARSAALAALAALLLAGLAAPAGAETMTFRISNGHPNAMRVQLYSDSRDHSWPGNGEDYYLDEDGTQEITLRCQSGEPICYGAWVDGDEGTYWGVGPGNTDRCEDCCYTCNGGATEEIDLVP